MQRRKRHKPVIRPTTGVPEIFEIGQYGDISHLPFTLRILLENILRNASRITHAAELIEAILAWPEPESHRMEMPFYPSRILMQDFLGVAALVDMAAMRDVIRECGGDPNLVQPAIPIELVVDHSVQVDHAGESDAEERNLAKEYERNGERYEFLRWCQDAFDDVRIIPPGKGIVHQINLEYLARVVCEQQLEDGQCIAFPDTVIGTDSHTPMVNALGVLGWGVGGIEAEAALLGLPVPMSIPRVVGIRLTGSPQASVTATDIVLTIVERLRQIDVVESFVEFIGPAVSKLSVFDRATISNMAPEYGATTGFFPIDEQTLHFLHLTGRTPEDVTRVESYARRQALFYDAQGKQPCYSQELEIDLSVIVPCVAGPAKPHDRVPLESAGAVFGEALRKATESGSTKADNSHDTAPTLMEGAVVIAAITSCTNTSNPASMISAGLLAKNAVARGLTTKPWVKTSLAPGSRVVEDYLGRAGLIDPLEQLGFHVVGYGCTTCIGNSGALNEQVAAQVKARNLAVCAVLSGNRNYEGRIHDDVCMNVLASPALVIAYALAGRIDFDIANASLGTTPGGEPVYLRDIWPERTDVEKAIAAHVNADRYRTIYASVLEGGERWDTLAQIRSPLFHWPDDSTYIQRPPYVVRPKQLYDDVISIQDSRVLAILGDAVNTDLIAPAGAIPVDSPAGKYLLARGIRPENFNSYGSRRGNSDISVRCILSSQRIRNKLIASGEGGMTIHHPTGHILPIFDAAMRYVESDTPLVILAGKQYGAGSSRDWAAKGLAMLGVRAVVAESFERIHRANLVGMGVLPLELSEGRSLSSLGLRGDEVLAIHCPMVVKGSGTVQAIGDDRTLEFQVTVRIDTEQELSYLCSGGILPYVVGGFLKRSESPQ
ncbi:aconitate hydratase AcnA [Comamonas sp. GB3 AK4-5]|uniref:aconitate hydratase AcnA n=1 Tax=Comamonas sp. GB3 AK4-5 TaxID=3231487 RepID=UPI00351DD967